MRILYVTQYYATPDKPGSLRHYTHTVALRQLGHEVTVISTYTPHKTPALRGMIPRLRNYMSFMVNAIRVGISIRARFDLVFASSPSLFVGLAGHILGLCHRADFVLEVRDLWPKSAVVLGFLKQPLLIWLASRLEKYLYRKASYIIAVTQGIATDIKSRIACPGRVHVVANGIDEELYRDIDPDTSQEIRRSLGEGFLAVYAGAHGANNSLDLLIDVAALLASEDRLKIILVGHGDRTALLKHQCEERGLDNVVFVGALPKAAVPLYLACADVLLWPVKWDDEHHPLRSLKSGACPNKVYDYLAAGKPVVSTTPPDGEGAALLRRFEAGIVVPPTASAVSEVLLTLLRDEKRRAAFGQRKEEAIHLLGRTRMAGILEQVLASVCT
jgi:colanic acid biosynthesis glycosyl transferase WcaI